MNTYIVLLRGINVGGHKKVIMAELRELLSRLGFTNVQSYIQSGNIVLNSSKVSLLEIEKTIADGIKSQYGFEVSVMAIKPKTLQTIFENNPFEEEVKKKSLFVLLHKAPSDEDIAIAESKEYHGETYIITKKCLYLYSEMGYGKAKFNLNYFERKLKTFATVRNYNTVVKLLSLSQ